MNSITRNLRDDQKGLVSIMVTIIIMLVIGLTVVGFARIVRREQRQSLDNQLSSQAFYAAETGVNAAIKALESGYIQDKQDCGPDGSTHFPADSNKILGGNEVEYSCLLIDQSPPALKYDNVDDRSSVIPIQTGDGSNINTLSISWEDQDGGNVAGCATVGDFPKWNDWPAPAPVGSCGADAGVLRADLVATAGNGLSRAQLVNNTFTAFFFPRPGGGPAATVAFSEAVGFGKQGEIRAAKCQNPSGDDRFCKITITNLGSSSYVLRLRSIYKPSKVTITATTSSGNNDLVGTQATIDVTGKANDVLRRIKVNVPLRNNGALFPDYAIETVGSICKRLKVAPLLPAEFQASPAECAQP